MIILDTRQFAVVAGLVIGSCLVYLLVTGGITKVALVVAIALYACIVAAFHLGRTRS